MLQMRQPRLSNLPRVSYPGKLCEPLQEGLIWRLGMVPLLVHTDAVPEKLWMSSGPSNERIRIAAEDRRDFTSLFRQE